MKTLNPIALALAGATATLTAATAAGAPENDRAAILAMAGEFEVTFNFHEPVVIADGYEPMKPYHEEASEKVYVAADEGDRIVLQHILVTSGGKRVVKHWKQEWVYQDREVYTYEGGNRWILHELPADEVAGMWTQRVSQVDDTPRYESYGKWEHAGGLSSWTSQPTRRPLPRREATKRDDYDVMIAVNRHTLTSSGWVHEQDNFKQVAVDGPVLCREVGLNTYDRTTEVDFAKADEYWEKTGQFWGDVSARWDTAMNEQRGLSLADEVDGKPVLRHMFSLATQVKNGELDLAAAGEAAGDIVEKFRLPVEGSGGS